MKLTYKSTAEDYRKYANKIIKPQNRKFSLSMCCICLGFILAFRLYFQLPPVAYILALIFALVCFIVILRALNERSLKAINTNIRKTGAEYYESDRTIDLLEDALETKSTLRHTVTPLYGIQSVSEDEDFIVIKFKLSDQIYIPIKGIHNIEDKDVFVSELKEKIAQRP
jgi:hypothetical protein